MQVSVGIYAGVSRAERHVAGLIAYTVTDCGGRRNFGRVTSGVTSSSDSHDIHWIVPQVTGAVRRGHYYGAGAIGLQTAIQDTKRRGQHRRLEIAVHGQRPAIHVGHGVVLRVRPAGQRHLAHLFVGRAIERPVTWANQA
jgi:hypothetical protein